MFDGNFRSRRDIDHSGTTNRRGRRDILKNAEAQRKERQEKLRREKAARLLERVVRGYFSRLQTVKRFLPQTHASMNALSMCLSYHSYLQKFNLTRGKLLLQFQGNGFTGNDIKGPHPMQDVERPSTRWFSQKRILENVLEELDPKGSNDAEQQTYLYRLLETYWESTRVDDHLFLILTTCLKGWCLESPYSSFTSQLIQWSVEASKRLENANSKALLASVLLGSSSSVASCQLTSPEDFSVWFAPLEKILSIENNTNVSSTATGATSSIDVNKDILGLATLENLKNGHEQRMLSNLLSLTDSPRLVLLIRHVLAQPENKNLKLAVALLVRGDTLDGSDITNDANTNGMNGWDDESEEEEDESEQQQQQDPSSKPSISKKPRGSGQYSRRELLTLVKLDKLYSERIQQVRQECIFDAPTKELAIKIASAPWVPWGLTLLSDGDAEKRLYVETLGLLLQTSSNLRPMTRLGVLSPVAFNKTILQGLWELTQQNRFEWCVSVFADLFSHYLVALSDQDFLQYHSCSHNDNLQSNAILAKNLVAFYGNVLYDVYWAKPVVANEIQIDSSRGRTMLSGTKVWNLLYERWNRLVKTSFCEENSWWFPHLTSREGDRAVVPARELEHAMNEDDVDDDSMDIDGSDQNQMSTADAETDALADSFSDPKMARILTSIPQALPFDRRVKLFHSLLNADKQKTLQAASSRRALMATGGQHEDDDMMFFFDGSVREQVKIRRAALYDDSMQQLNSLGGKLKNRVQVSFINQHGAEEAGIDGGGVFKEFLDDLIKDGFAAKNGDASFRGAPQLFTITPMQTLTVNLDMTEEQEMLAHYEFLGRVLGKAVYESILVEPQFCLPFLNQLLGKANTLEDLKNYDDEYYTNLSKLRQFDETEIDSLSLTFELTVGGGTKRSTPRTVDLLRNGRSMPVTKRNVFQYTQLVANQLLNVQGAQQTRAFLRGFRDLIPVSWVRLFSAKELQKLISGDDKPIDILALRRVMHYLGGYHESQPYIEVFWDVLENELTPDQQRKFLKFMTSCSRQPLLGFSSLEPVPSIQQVRLGDDELSKNSRLPTSQTCMNLLKLPNYQDRELLKQKLLAAVESGAGFELT